mgnify:CR=1 FL=1
MLDAAFSEMFPTGQDQTDYRHLSADGIVIDSFRGRKVLAVEPYALTALTAEAFKDVSHLLRPGHLAQLRSIMDDP